MNLPSKSEVQVALDPSRVLQLMAVHAWFLVFCGLLGLGLAFAYMLQRAPVYVSQAVLEVREDAGPQLDFERPGASDLNSAALLKTIEQTVASQAVLQKVITTLKLAEDPWFAPPRPEGYTDSELLTLLNDRIHVSLIRGTRLIAIQVRDGDPLKARRLAESVVEAFFAERLSLRREGADSAHAFLLTEARRLEQEVRAAEERLQDYQEKHQAVSLTERSNIVTQRLNDLARQVTETRATRLALQPAHDHVVAVIDTDPVKIADLREISALQDIIDLRREHNAHAAEVASLALRYREKHPSLIQARRELAQMDESLRTALATAGRALVRAYESTRTNEQALERELALQQEQAMNLSRLAIAYRALEREAQSTDALYQQVLSRLKTSGLGQSLAAAGTLDRIPIQVIERPLVPVHPSGVSGKLILLAGVLGGLGLGAVIVVLRRAFDPSFQCLDDAEACLGVPSLAAVPRSTLRGADLVIHSHPATLEAESFRSLRTSLALVSPEETPRSVLFTSAVPGEGKSYCSANYAASLAQQGLRTLLIDGDLRRPGLRLRFAAERATQGPGLSDCLRDPSRLAEAIRPTRLHNLCVVGDLHGSVRGAELLQGPNFKTVLDSALGVFDRVVIDTAPLAAVGDTAALAPHVGAICLVVHAGRTPRRVVRRACVILGRRPSGLVLNQIKTGRSARYDYYSHGEDYVRDTPATAAAPA